jgi:4-hydroxy-2-oxoheptanedioate aldolase
MSQPTALQRRRRLVGTVLTLPGAVTAETLADPWDIVWIDLEHGALGLHEAQEMIIGAQAAGALALARLSAVDAWPLIPPLLDAGADGLVAPDARNDEQVRALVRAMTLRPDGDRGHGPRRSALRHRARGLPLSRPELWVQIESAAGVSAADDIAAVAGVDALIVGTADLSIALATPGDLSSAAMLDALTIVADAARRHDVRFGVAGALSDPPGLLEAILAGADVLVHATDARICAWAVDNAAAEMRALAPNGG